MAVKTAKQTGNSSETATWTPETVLTTTDELVIPTGIKVTFNANATVVSLKTEGAKPEVTNNKSLTLTGTGAGTIKTLELASGTVWASGAGAKLIIGNAGATTTEPVTNGVDVKVLVLSGGATSKYKLSEKLTTSTELVLKAGILSTAGFEVSTGRFVSESASVKELILGASTIKCSANSSTGVAWALSGENCTVKAETSTIELTATTEATFEVSASNPAGKTYNAVKFASAISKLLSSATFSLTIPTLTFPAAGTAVIFESNATTNVTTVTWPTGAFKIDAATAGTAAKLKQTTGTVEVKEAKIKDSTAEGGATFKDINGENVSGNTGWTFEVASTGGGLSMML